MGKLVDPEAPGKVIPFDGEAVGELTLRGPTITQGYHKLPSDRSWLPTGDIASIDKEGYVQIRDRAKDLIKSGGEWISSADMENHIVALPEVAACAVVAVPHPKWDERPVAVCVAAPGCTLNHATVLKHCSSAFAKFQLPDDTIVWKELPYTGTGKLDKKTVRKMLQERGYKLPSLSKL